MKTLHPNEQIWLVKTGDRIVGPFFQTTLIEKLLAREIVVIDEVARPGGRWTYIREEPVFAETVAEIWSRSQGLREDTDIATLSSTDRVQNAEKTQTVTPFLEWSLTGPGQMVPIRDNFAGAEQAKSQLSQGETAKHNQKNGREQQKSNFSAWWLLSLAAFALGAFVILRFKESEPKPAGSSFGSVAAEALQKDRVGDFAGSLKLLRVAHQLRPADPDISLRLATLAFRIDHQTVEAKRIVNETLALTHDPDHVVRGQTILSLIAKSEGDLTESEDLLKESLKMEPAFVAAHFNLGVLYFIKGQYAEAQKLFTEALGLDSTLNMARFMWSLAQLHLNPKADLTGLVPPFVIGPLRQEQALLQDASQASAQSLQKVFLQDPFLTDEYRIDPLLDTEPVNWKNLSPFCDKISAAGGKQSQGIALLIICKLKAGQKVEANRLAADSLATKPQDVALLEANAYLLLDFGKDEEAQGSLQLAMRSSSDVLSSILMARACKESQDTICEREQWKRTLEKDPGNLPALVNLARLEYESGNKDEAHAFFEKARPLAADYMPWLQLNEMLGGVHQ